MSVDGTVFASESDGPSAARRRFGWLLLGVASVVAVVLLVLWGTDVFASAPGGGCGGG